MIAVAAVPDFDFDFDFDFHPPEHHYPVCLRNAETRTHGCRAASVHGMHERFRTRTNP